MRIIAIALLVSGCASSRLKKCDEIIPVCARLAGNVQTVIEAYDKEKLKGDACQAELDRLNRMESPTSSHGFTFGSGE